MDLHPLRRSFVTDSVSQCLTMSHNASQSRLSSVKLNMCDSDLLRLVAPVASACNGTTAGKRFWSMFWSIVVFQHLIFDLNQIPSNAYRLSNCMQLSHKNLEILLLCILHRPNKTKIGQKLWVFGDPLSIPALWPWLAEPAVQAPPLHHLTLCPKLPKT